ncbi:MAG TPA: DUF5665 domain-containing protein [Candidatus Saccharimonadales bacterium]|nr:DUF5665 domain-containing protein [Candidatus Saccharimonadales bacterium]
MYDEFMEPTEAEKQKTLNQLVNAVNRSYQPTHSAMWRGFLIGIAGGLGTTLGVAIVLSLIGFLVRELGGLPVIGAWFSDVGAIIPKR